LLLILDGLVGEIRKAMEFHLSSRKTRVTKIILSGGGAYLPAFPSYLSETFGGIEVVVGDPLAVARPGRGITLPREKAVYSVSIGLSQRVF
jgi:Tfp pilus assembly PilM family ATPase